MSGILILSKLSDNDLVIKKNKAINFILFLSLAVGLCGCSLINAKKMKKPTAKAKRKITSGPSQKGDGSFVDVTEKYGLKGVSGVRFNAVDLNNDGFTDLVVLPSFYSQPRFFYFDSEKQIFKENRYTPFAKSTKASFLLFYDLDKDDVIDLVAGVLNQKTELTKHSIRVYKGSIINKRIWFTELKDILKSDPSPTASISLIDYNLDGELDIFAANWFKYDKKNNPWPVPDRLYVKDGNSFKETTEILVGELTKNETNENYIYATPSYSSSTCDLNNDGFPDILTTSTNGYANKMWINEYVLLGNKRSFKDIGRKSLFAMDLEGYHVPRGGGRTFFSSCADYNNDGLMDIYLGEMTHSYDSDSVDRSSILTRINNKNSLKYIRTEYLGDSETFNWSRADKRASWIDLNLDGKLDLLVDNSGFPPYSRLVLFEQDENKDFFDTAKDKGIDVLNPEGTILMDFNSDGIADIVTGQSNIRNSSIKQRIYLYQNNHQLNGHKTLRVYPKGTKSNTSALGGMVILESELNGEKLVRRQYVEYSQGGLPSQNEEGLFFTIAPNETPKKIHVKWPIYQSTRGKGRSFLERSYSLEGIKFKDFNVLTTCEDGRVFFKKKSCR